MKVDFTVLSRARERRDPYQLRSLRIKVVCARPPPRGDHEASQAAGPAPIDTDNGNPPQSFGKKETVQQIQWAMENEPTDYDRVLESLLLSKTSGTTR